MSIRSALVVLALTLAACGQPGPQQAVAPSAQSAAPEPEAQPESLYTPANEAARSATGQLAMSVTLRLPDAGADSTDQQEVLTLRGASGLVVEAAIVGAVSPATQVQGQTLRALLDMPVEEPQVLVYRVTNETKPEGVGGLCGGEAAAYVVVWEPTEPGSNTFRVLATQGGAPGANAARACPMLDYNGAG